MSKKSFLKKLTTEKLCLNIAVAVMTMGFGIGAAWAVSEPSAPPEAAVEITGAGASLPYPIYAQWASAYHQATGQRVNYQSIGSGGGQQQIIAGTVAFGASDDPMSAADLEAHDLLQFPAIIGGVVPVFNLPGVAPGALKFTGAVLADIFRGVITRWNDPQIQELNPDIDLPDQAIVVIHRSDGSGTTFLWSHYLAQASADWRDQVGVGKAIKWPVGHGGKGNEGVAANVRQLQYSLGYVEFAYALQNELSWAQMQNKNGQFVQPSEDSFAAAAEHAEWAQTPSMGVILTDMPGEHSWPITATSFILVHQTQADPAQGRATLQFFDWAFEQGSEMARALDYVPLPVSVVTEIRARWAEHIRDRDGQAIWPSHSNAQ